MKVWANPKKPHFEVFTDFLFDSIEEEQEQIRDLITFGWYMEQAFRDESNYIYSSAHRGESRLYEGTPKEIVAKMKKERDEK